MNILFVLHDPPYGTERVYNGLRWATEVARRDGHEVKVFLFGDAVVAAAQGQNTPQGYYNTGRMASGLVRLGGEIGCCGTCMDARALAEDGLIEGAHRSSMKELADWTLWAGQVINV
ncbi:DsrE/DsrF/TusD sulfur relay family protein [Streptomyces sp. YIM 98790]|uniref:DsrE/DsrF/TusD sulfur relay family protein n=1 Tax=Streptomyces sp. YIM 98790 TaxID=2689077 RepID=UPI00140B6DA6|nr:DsrE family protein [Streptomyces sp. YIM 98790]